MPKTTTNTAKINRKNNQKPAKFLNSYDFSSIMQFIPHIREWHSYKDLAGLSKPVKRMTLITLLYYLGWGITIPFLPLYFKEILGSYSAVGLVTGVLQLFSFLLAFMFGPIIDRVSKRSLIALVLALYLPISPLLLGLRTLTHFLLFRTYHAVIATTYWLSSESYVRGHSNKGKESEAMALFDAGSGLAQVMGALVGAALIVRYGYSIFYAISLFAGLALIAAFSLPDHKKEPLMQGFGYSLKEHIVRKEVKDFLANKEFRNLVIFSFFFTLGTGFLAMLLPLFLDTIGASLPLIGIITAIFFLPVLFEPYFSTVRNKKALLTASLALSALLFLALFFTKNVLASFGLSFALGITLAAATPIVSGRLTQLMPKEKIGELSGILYGIRSLAAGLSPIVAGYASDILSLNSTFLGGAAIIAVLAILSGKVINGQKRSIE